MWLLVITVVVALALVVLGGCGGGDRRTRALARLPGDAAQIAFTHSEKLSETADDEIRLLSADGFQITIVENASGPAWSPDGTRIAFERPSSVGEYSNDIWVVGAGGSNPSQLTSGPMSDSSPAWSPDGRRLAFIRDEGIYVMNADGSGVRPIARPTEEVGYSTPTWSPGGTEIAFSSWVVNIYRADLWRMSADGSRRSRLTTRPDIDDSPDWSPDGRKIVYAAGDGGISVIAPTGGHPVAVTRQGAGLAACFAAVCDLHPAWSPDGRWIVFDRGNGSDERTGIFMIGVGGRGLRQLTDGDDSDPAWQPRLASG